MMTQQCFMPDAFWQDLVRQRNTPSECHCKCGEIFFSLSHYIGKKTKNITQTCCPSCGSWEMDYVIPQPEKESDDYRRSALLLH